MLIVTDGAVDPPGQIEHSPLLRVVPGQVWLGAEPFEGRPEEFWKLLRGGTYPSTTPPTVSALAEAYQHPDLVLGIHVSGALSATLTRAREAASRAGPGVVVIDTRSISVGAGLIVAAVHRAIEGARSQESIVDMARSLPSRLHTFALIQDLETLRRSNRMGLVPQAHLHRRHPLILSVRGRTLLLEQSKDRAGALRCLATHVKHSAGAGIGAWAIGHGDASDCETLIDGLSGAIGCPPSFVVHLDPIVGTHVGPDSVIVGVLADRSDG